MISATTLKIFRKISAISIAGLIAVSSAACSEPAKPVALIEDSRETEQDIKQTEPTPAEPTPAETADPAATPPPVEPVDQPPEPEPIDYEKTSPYEVGQVMIIMYHAIVEGEPPSQWQRNVDDFRNDLQTLYDDGFRLCTLKDLMENNVSVPAGYTPVVLTFDDGKKQTFSLEQKEDGSLYPKENTGVYILEEFCKQYPDFGRGATFYIHSGIEPFPGAGTVGERLNWLVERGYDIGNHTQDHAELNILSGDEIQEQLGSVDKFVRENVPGYEPVGVSYPYGKRPADELLKYILKGEFEGKEYNYKFALKEGYNGKPSAPNRKDFDALNVPRVCGSSIPGEDQFDLGYFLKYYKENPQYKYVSDGNPGNICVPEKYRDNVDMESLGEKKLVLY